MPHPVVGAELFQADRETDGRTAERTEGQTNITKPVAALRNFAKAPKKEKIVIYIKVIRECRTQEILFYKI